jgi:hypothetical protein
MDQIMRIPSIEQLWQDQQLLDELYKLAARRMGEVQ